MTEISRDTVKKAIRKSQHCQRNWDLSKGIPQTDIDLLVTAVSECPSKQNIAYYRTTFITNREVIEKLHDQTNGFVYSFETGASVTNSQVLANLLVVFESRPVELKDEKDANRNTQAYEMANNQDISPETRQAFERDRNMAVGIAAGYLNLSANLMGYSTGCCACFSTEGVKEILGLSGEPLLLMGIGFRDADRSRLEHHTNADFIFPTKAKQPIETKIVE